jgi:hypothetical protein
MQQRTTYKFPCLRCSVRREADAANFVWLYIVVCNTSNVLAYILSRGHQWLRVDKASSVISPGV